MEEGYPHHLINGEIKDGRIYISMGSVEEFKRSFGKILERPFSIYRSDGKYLLRSPRIQWKKDNKGFRLNFGKDTFSECTEGTKIWLRPIKDGDMEVQIESPSGPILDKELFNKCLPALENPTTENYWEVATSAGVILEDRLRKLSGGSSKIYGTYLVESALNPSTGKLICREDEEERKGVYHLCLGVMKALRNPSVHRVQDFPRTRARQVVGIIDLLLGEINAAETRPE